MTNYLCFLKQSHQQKIVDGFFDIMISMKNIVKNNVKQKLLIIGYVWPEPNSSAAGSRMIQLIHFFLQHQYQITFASPAQQTDHMADLESLNVESVAITLNCESFDTFITELQPDVVLFDRFMMEEQFGWRFDKHSPQSLKLLDTEDLFSLRHARHGLFKHMLKNQKKLANGSTNNNDISIKDILSSAALTSILMNSDMAKREVAAIFRCDLTLMISTAEIALLQQLFNVPANILHYNPFMFDEAQLQQVNPVFEQRADFISIGNFRHAPNWDAVLWLKQQIWPLIRAQLPNANLLICGAYPPPKATALHDDKSGFLVKGWVDDAVVAMQSAKVCLAPLRFGAGIKGKLAEAMMCGTPSVTTDIGAESMQEAMSSQAWGGAIANTPQEIANAAVRLYQQKTCWQTASDFGVDNVRRKYQAKPLKEALSLALYNVLDDLTMHRQQNFIGAMLNHHHHKSTQYMAQWIAAKNKIPLLSLPLSQQEGE